MAEASEVAKRGTAAQRSVERLNSWARWVGGTVGLSSMGAGAVATFTTESEAGPVALLAVGVLLLIAAMSGRLPTRVKIGENEAEWQAVQDYVEASIEEATPDTRPELLSQLNELAKSVPQVVTPALEAAVYEQVVVDMVRSVAADLDPVVAVDDGTGAARHAFDIVLRTSTGEHIVVEAKASRLTFTRLERAYGQFAARQANFAPATLLVVTTEVTDAAARQFSLKHRDAHVVRVRGMEDREVLRKTLNELVQR